MSESEIKYSSDKEILSVTKALSSVTRLAILKTLIGEEKSITDLAVEFEQTEANISAQVKILINVGLVEFRHEPGKHGRTKICTSNVKNLIITLK